MAKEVWPEYQQSIKFSIIVAAYNVAPYIDDCIRSIMNSTYQNWELLILNDGSTDGTTELLSQYEFDERVKCFDLTRVGLGAARNYGMAKAMGEYLLFVDGDDYISRELLDTLANHINKLQYDVINFSWYRIKDNGILKKRENEKFQISKTIAVWNKCYRTDFLKEESIVFPENVNFEDVEFSMKTQVSAERVTHCRKPLYFYRERLGGLSTQNVAEDDRLHVLNQLNNLILMAEYNKNKKLIDDYIYKCSMFHIEQMLVRGHYGAGLIKFTHFLKTHFSESFPEQSDETLFYKVKHRLIIRAIENRDFQLATKLSVLQGLRGRFSLTLLMLKNSRLELILV